MALLVLGACVPDGLDGFFVLLQGSVADEAGAPVAGAQVTLANGDGEDLGEATSDSEGRWAFPVHGLATEGNRVEAEVRASGMEPGRAGWDVNLLSPEVVRLSAGPNETWEATPRVLAPARLAAEGGGRATGTLTDPLGYPAAGIPFVVQHGWDAGVGAANEASGVTGASGEFSFTVASAGLYTVYAAPTGGWAGTRFPVLATAEGNSSRATIAALQAPGETLITLTWASEVDLDLHVSGPETDAEAEASRFHIWTDNTIHPERLVDEDEYLAELVQAASTGPGPECIAVNRAPGAGELWISVADRANMSETESTTLAESGALLQWWNGEDIPRYAWVSPLEVATSWRAVEIDTRGGTVYAVEHYAVGLDPSDDGEF
ncbi:MAG: carboxypeptidase regulatory-like domain-containing protein [Deltaproteobacteria bacterium]|nr:carboxypeptidase regulatory-like domain-containing protein [Deltaproteobacteria bacterium]